jgi:hypothetical protein
MVALGFALLLGVIALFALGCWLDRPGLFEGGASEELFHGDGSGAVEPARDAPIESISPQTLFDPELGSYHLGEEAA